MTGTIVSLMVYTTLMASSSPVIRLDSRVIKVIEVCTRRLVYDWFMRLVYDGFMTVLMDLN